MAVAALIIASFNGCALLRSSPRAPEEWAFVAFPRSSESAVARTFELAAHRTVAASCAEVNVVTFAVESCVGTRDLGGRSDKSLVIVGNSSAHGYRADVLRAIMADPAARGRFAAQAVGAASTGQFGGLLLDLRELGARDVSSLLPLVAAVTDSARADSVVTVGIVVPVADTAAYPGRHLGALTDFLALRMEVEPADPGPITPSDRMAGLLGARAGEIGAHRLMVVIPADGYIWRSGEPRARTSFQEAVATAADWGVDLVRDESSGTLRARAPLRGEIWVNDAVLIGRILRAARRLGIRRFALYGLGGEDPGILSLAVPEESQTMIRSR